MTYEKSILVVKIAPIILALLVNCSVAKSTYVRQYGVHETLFKNTEDIIKIDTIGNLKRVTFKGH
jgi:hypothetical protein